ANGNIYVTVSNGRDKAGNIYLLKSGQKKVLLDSGIKSPGGIALSPDQTQLYVVESASHWVWAFTILQDGKLANKQRYGWLYAPDDRDNAGASKITCDRDGRMYVATTM